MNHELAKRLKDSGFPQKGKGTWYAHLVQDGGTSGEGYWREYDHYGDLYIPALSELIEACGDEFIALQHINLTEKWKHLSGHEYTQFWGCSGINIASDGATPEEAVANLWLALTR